MIKQKVSKSEGYLLLWILFLAIMMMGMVYNFEVITNNQGRMPVKWDSYFDGSEEYVLINGHNEIKYQALADILGVKGKFMFSVGDVMIIIGLFGSVFSSVKWGIVKKRGEKETWI